MEPTKEIVEARKVTHFQVKHVRHRCQDPVKNTNFKTNETSEGTNQDKHQIALLDDNRRTFGKKEPCQIRQDTGSPHREAESLLNKPESCLKQISKQQLDEPTMEAHCSRTRSFITIPTNKSRIPTNQTSRGPPNHTAKDHALPQVPNVGIINSPNCGPTTTTKTPVKQQQSYYAHKDAAKSIINSPQSDNGSETAQDTPENEKSDCGKCDAKDGQKHKVNNERRSEGTEGSRQGQHYEEVSCDRRNSKTSSDGNTNRQPDIQPLGELTNLLPLQEKEVPVLEIQDKQLLQEFSDFQRQEEGDKWCNPSTYGIYLQLGRLHLEDCSNNIKEFLHQVYKGFVVVETEVWKVNQRILEDIGWRVVQTLLLLEANSTMQHIEATNRSKHLYVLRRSRRTREDKTLAYWNFHFVQASQEDVILVDSIASVEEQALAATQFLDRTLTGPDVKKLYFSLEHVNIRKIIDNYYLFKVELQMKVRALKVKTYRDANNLTDSEVLGMQSGDYDKTPRPPIKFTNMEHNFPTTHVNEVGYGENTAIDPQEKTKIMEAIDQHLQSIPYKVLQATGFKQHHIERYRQTLRDNYEAFGLETSIAQMSLLTPLEVKLKPHHQPCLARGRVMPSQEQQVFLDQKLKDLTAMGIVRPAKNPIYGCTGFTVPKKGPKRWRLVIDMRPLNEISEKSALKLPNLEQQLGFLGKAGIFAAFDVLSGFDFLPTAESSRQYFNIITAHGAHQMCGAPMGWLNTPMIFQERIMNEILRPAGLYGNIDTGACQWIDDSLIYSTSPAAFIDAITKFLQAVKKKRLRLNIRKTVLLQSEVEWCGRLLKKDSWMFQPKFFSKILEVPRPRYAHQLAQCLYITTWLSPSIPEFAQLRSIFAPIVNLRGRTLKALEKERVEIKWTTSLFLAWKEFINRLFHASKTFLQNYDSREGLVLFMDASHRFWSLIVAQASHADISRNNFRLLRPKPMIFLSGEFKNSQLNWHISQKEFFPLIVGLERLDFLLLGHPSPVAAYTDHKNLVSILRPTWSPSKSYATRLFRWAMALQQLDLFVHHVAGEENHLADLLSRWGRGQTLHAQAQVLPALQEVQPREENYRVRAAGMHDQDVEDPEKQEEEDSQDDLQQLSASSRSTILTTITSNSARTTTNTRPGTKRRSLQQEAHSQLKKWGNPGDQQEAHDGSTIGSVSSISSTLSSLSTILGLTGTGLTKIAQQFTATQGWRESEQSISTMEGETGAMAEVNSQPTTVGSQNSMSPPSTEDWMDASRLEESERQYRVLELMDKAQLSYLNPHFRGGFQPLTEHQLREAQLFRGPPDGMTKNENGLYVTGRGKLWVPQLLWKRLLIQTHIGLCHPSIHSEMEYLKKYRIELPPGLSLRELLRSLHQTCVHCQRIPGIIRRPYKITLLAKKPREILLLDYLYIRKKEYLLVLVDAHSRKTELRFCEKASAANVVELLLTFQASYGFLASFVVATDGGSHFANTVMKELQEELRFMHKFSVAYCPWTHGACETTHRSILENLRQLTSEYSLPLPEWPRLIKMVQHIMNSRPMTRRNGLTANEIFMGYRQEREIFGRDQFLVFHEGAMRMPRDHNNVIQQVRKLQEGMSTNEKRVYETVKRVREQQNKGFNEREKRVQQHFQAGDWVMLSTVGTPQNREKLKLRWTGPFQIQETLSESLYRIRSLTGSMEEAHGSRLWYYAPIDFTPSDDLVAMFADENQHKEIRRIGKFRKYKGTWEALVTWKGLEKVKSTWKKVSQLMDDHPEETRRAVRRQTDDTQLQIWEEIANDLTQEEDRVVRNITVQKKGKWKFVPKPRLVTWTPMEALILQRCVMGYGVGNLEEIVRNNHLPGRTRVELWQATKDLLQTEDLMPYYGIHVDCDRVRERNWKSDKTKICALDSGVRLTDQEVEEVRIPYFRRIGELLNEDECLRNRSTSGKVKEIKSLRKLDERDKSWHQSTCQYMTPFCQALADWYVTFPESGWEEFITSESKWKDGLAEVYCNQLGHVKINAFLKRTLRCFEEESWTNTLGSYGSKFFFDKWVHVRIGKEQVVAKMNGDNTYTLRSLTRPQTTTQDMYIFPEKSVSIVGLPTSNKLRRRLDDLGNPWMVLISPDWEKCRTVKEEKQQIARLKKLNWMELQQEGFLFIWMANDTFQELKQRINEARYRELGKIEWIKLTEKGTLLSTKNGKYVKRMKETCWVLTRNLQEKEIELKLPKCILAEQMGMGRKPVQIYKLMERLKEQYDLGNQGLLVELYGTYASQRPNWVTIGEWASLDDQEAHVAPEITCDVDHTYVRVDKTSVMDKGQADTEVVKREEVNTTNRTKDKTLGDIASPWYYPAGRKVMKKDTAEKTKSPVRITSGDRFKTHEKDTRE